MKKYYTQLWILFFVVFSFPTLSAQNGNKISNNGLQLGVLVDGNFAQRMSVNQNNGGMNEPLTQPAMGWKSGIELSYNFWIISACLLELHTEPTCRLNSTRYTT